MIPEIPVTDLMKRTMHNLETIEQLERSREQGVYEVTQLVNSFLAALVHPWEVWEKKLNEKDLKEASENGWPQLHKSDPLDDDPKTLGDLLRLVRNAFAHGNVEFVPDNQMNIKSIRIWNRDNEGLRTWGTEATLEDIRKFLACFVELANTLGSPPPRPPMRHRNDPNRAKTPRVKCPTCDKWVAASRINSEHRESQQMRLDDGVPAMLH